MENIARYLALTSCLAFTPTLQAVTASFAGFDGDGGSSSGYTVTIDDTGQDIKYNFTFTGDIDGCGAAGVTGAANDTFSFTLTDKFYEGSTFSGNPTTAGSLTLGTQVDNAQESGTSALHFGSNDNGTVTNAYLNTGDSFEMSISNISYTRGETNVDQSVTFNGFNSANVFYASNTANASAQYLIGTSGTSVSKTDNGSADRNIALNDAQTVLFTQTASGGSSNARLRIRDLNFDFDLADSHEQIPEPSSALLLGLGALGFASRRRR